MSDKVINSVTKIPLLGDIPILGFFFRNTTKHIVKTNLIIALTPYVINDQSDLRRVLEKKMKERREFVERFGGEERPDLEARSTTAASAACSRRSTAPAREVEKEEDEMDRSGEHGQRWTSRGRSICRSGRGRARRCRPGRAAADGAAGRAPARRRHRRTAAAAGAGRALRRHRACGEKTDSASCCSSSKPARDAGSHRPRSSSRRSSRSRREGGRLGEILVRRARSPRRRCCRRWASSWGSPIAPS